jgi:hypothetical protein
MPLNDRSIPVTPHPDATTNVRTYGQPGYLAPDALDSCRADGGPQRYTSSKPRTDDRRAARLTNRSCAAAGVVLIPGGSQTQRLVQTLFAQVQRIMEINNLSTVTKEAVETSREALVIGILKTPLSTAEHAP